MLSFFFQRAVCEYQQNFVFLLELFNNPIAQDPRILDERTLYTVFDGFSLDEKVRPSKYKPHWAV
jgi:hypothetical protein